MVPSLTVLSGGGGPGGSAGGLRPDRGRGDGGRGVRGQGAVQSQRPTPATSPLPRPAGLPGLLTAAERANGGTHGICTGYGQITRAANPSMTLSVMKKQHEPPTYTHNGLYK